MKRLLAFGWALLFVLLASTASAQGVLIIIDPPHPTPLPRPRPQPQPAATYKIKEIGVSARITDQVAQVQVSQSFVNTGSRQMEVSFVFPLPYDGAIDRMTFMVDGKEYDAKLLSAKKAREIYEGYIRRNQDPALLEWVGTGMFQTSVFPVPPGAERKVSLKFSQLLRKNHQLTDFLFPLSTAKYTAQAVEQVSFDVSIESAHEIKSVYSPTHPIEVKRPDSKRAVVKWEAKNQVPVSDFRLLYDTADGKLGASVLSYKPEAGEDGYFLLLASPEVKSKSQELPAKTVIFVVDRSGSMSGKKFEQAREALKFVLNNLREGDTFNIVAYDSNVESFRPELQKYDDATRKAALGFVDGLYAGGSTNIDGALATALGQIKDHARPSFVLFLTDGLPTAGETNEAKIVANARQRNDYGARVVSFGVGYDLNSRLLDRLSHENHGQTEYVRPDENIEAAVSRLYSKMSSPVMTKVAVKIEVDAASGSNINRVYPKEVRDLFAGEQLVQVGRYKQAGDAKVVITGSVGSEEKKFDFPAKLVEKSSDQSFAFVEKLWAIRRVGEIIDELDLKGKNDELITELVQLSTKHGILTPYTSFLADDQARPSELANSRLQFEQTRRNLESLDRAEGASGVAQRAEKYELKQAAQAQAATAPAANAPIAPGGRISGGGAGFGKFRDIESDKEVAAGDAVRNVGNDTLYKRGKLLIAYDAKDVDPDKDAAKIQSIKRYSDEYFALIRENTAAQNALLAQQKADETMLVKFRGQVYRIE